MTKNFDISKYDPSSKDHDTLFGLPQEVKFCQKCVISNQRPNSTVEYKHTKESKKDTINFNAQGECDACSQAARKNETDWLAREKELEELCNKNRSKDGSYDCLIPGSGGKDSFYQAHILKYKYNMNPLTVTWAPNIYTDWGRRNHDKWIHSGFDNYLVTSNGRAKRLLTRLAVENLFHPFQPFIFGQKSLAPKLAAQFNIPLVFYGENEAEYGNPVEDNNKSLRDWSYFTQTEKSEIFLGGTSIESLKNDYGLSEADLSLYVPANPELIKQHEIEVHYLGYYLKWHPQSAYYYAVEHGNFEASPERTAGTYSKYNSIDDKIDDFHYFTTFIKFGIGRTTYDASQEVRSGDITREEAIMLIKRYDGEFPERFADEVFDYLSIPGKEFPKASNLFEYPIMTKETFNELTNKFRSPHIWQYKNNQWSLRHTIYE